MTVKEKVLEVITRMPDDSTLDDIGYELYVIESVQKGLDELGWEVPVIEGNKCSIVLAKALVDLGVSVSGLMFPGDHPKKRTLRKIFL